jgi:hypothetical protein
MSTRQKDEKYLGRDVPADKLEIVSSDGNYLINTIGAYKMGENGTCVEFVKEFKLG